MHTHTHTHAHTHTIHAGGGGGGVKPFGKAQPPDQKAFEREINAVSREIKEKQAKLVCSRVVLWRECEWDSLIPLHTLSHGEIVWLEYTVLLNPVT